MKQEHHKQQKNKKKKTLTWQKPNNNMNFAIQTTREPFKLASNITFATTYNKIIKTHVATTATTRISTRNKKKKKKHKLPSNPLFRMRTNRKQ